MTDSSFDFQSVDKSGFVCLQMEDDSIYYGEVAWFDEQGTLVSETFVQSHEAEVRKKLDSQPGQEVRKKVFKRRRHGLGAQVFTRSDGSVLCKYEGSWSAGKMEGEGAVSYPDSSVYIGSGF